MSEATSRTLVAGVGNIFLTDDGFGCEVVRALADRPMPDSVRVKDFGVSGVHLAYELLDCYDLLLIVDAAPRGREPGTVSLLEVNLDEADSGVESVSGGEMPLLDVHGMEPAAILSMLSSLGGRVDRVLLVACEPESVEEGIGLSDVVAGAVPAAVALVEQVVRGEHDAMKEVSSRWVG
jgi:hydrogenase maturation protease